MIEVHNRDKMFDTNCKAVFLLGRAVARLMIEQSGGRIINVTTVGPGVTRTQFSKPLWGNPDLAKRVVRLIPKGRIAEPEEIVGAVLFLASVPPVTSLVRPFTWMVVSWRVEARVGRDS
jgi:NAD(P)-dependent dehydrogenase (short-subunit alcohol dehydrogenase family)